MMMTTEQLLYNSNVVNSPSAWPLYVVTSAHNTEKQQFVPSTVIHSPEQLQFHCVSSRSRNGRCDRQRVKLISIKK